MTAIPWPRSFHGAMRGWLRGLIAGCVLLTAPAALAFPGVTTASTNGTTSTTSPLVNLPSGINSGDTLLVLIRACVSSATITAPNEGTDWIQLFEDGTEASDDTTALFWRKASGGESSTVTFTFSSSAKFAAIAWRGTGATDPTVQPPEFSTLVIGPGTTDTPDPGNLSPTGGAKDYLWLWMGGWEGEQTSPPAGNPTNYSTPIGADSDIAGAVTTNCRVATAERQLNAASEDPGSWTLSAANDWTAWVVALHPSGGAAPACPKTLTLLGVGC